LLVENVAGFFYQVVKTSNNFEQTHGFRVLHNKCKGFAKKSIIKAWIDILSVNKINIIVWYLKSNSGKIIKYTSL